MLALGFLNQNEVLNENVEAKAALATHLKIFPKIMLIKGFFYNWSTIQSNDYQST